MADVFRFPSTPPPVPPKNIHRATFFTVIGPTNRPLTCAAYEIETGLELRLAYADDEVMRSELFRGVDADEQIAGRADDWRRMLVTKGFREIENSLKRPANQTAVLKAHGHSPIWVWKKGNSRKGTGKLSPQSRAIYRQIDLHFHDLRHEAGSRLLEAGWPLHEVQQMLGHASIQQTSTYLNATLRGLHRSMRASDQARARTASHFQLNSPVAGNSCNPVASTPSCDSLATRNETSPHSDKSLVN